MDNQQHTQEPWFANRNSSFWEINPTNGGENGIPFSVADVCSSAPGFPDGGLQEANARRIVACVNACAGIPTDVLEDDCFSKMREDRDMLMKQRDELLAALNRVEQVALALDAYFSYERGLDVYIEELNAIARVKGNAA